MLAGKWRLQTQQFATDRCVEPAHALLHQPRQAHLREYRYMATATPAAATPAPDMAAACRGAATRLS